LRNGPTSARASLTSNFEGQKANINMAIKPRTLKESYTRKAKGLGPYQRV